MKKRRQQVVEEFVWLRLVFADLDPSVWQEIADYLNTVSRLHFHVISFEEAEEGDPKVTRELMQHYNRKMLKKFAQYILNHGGKAYISPATNFLERAIARVMLLCNDETEYLSIRKELSERFPIPPTSGQLEGLVYTDDGDLLRVVR